MQNPLGTAASTVRSLFSSKRLQHFMAAMAMALCFLGVPVQAALLYSQPYAYKADQNGVISDTRLPQYIADNFILGANDDVSRVSWYGYWSGGLEDLSTKTFNINFYDDASNKPATLLSSQNVTVTGTMVGAVSSSVPQGMYEIRADLPSSVALSGGSTYWLSIYENGNVLSDFHWATATSGLNYYAWSSNLSTWGSAATDVYGRQYLAFSLESGGSAAVPEPGQVAASILLLAGFGGYVLLKRRAHPACGVPFFGLFHKACHFVSMGKLTKL